MNLDGAYEISVFFQSMDPYILKHWTGVEDHLQVRIIQIIDFHFLKERGILEKLWDSFYFWNRMTITIYVANIQFG